MAKFSLGIRFRFKPTLAVDYLLKIEIIYVSTLRFIYVITIDLYFSKKVSQCLLIHMGEKNLKSHSSSILFTTVYIVVTL